MRGEFAVSAIYSSAVGEEKLGEQKLKTSYQYLAESLQKVEQWNQSVKSIAKFSERADQAAKLSQRLSINTSIEAVSEEDRQNRYQEISKESEKLSQQLAHMAKQMNEWAMKAQFESKTVTSLMESACEQISDSLIMIKQSELRKG